MIIDPENNSCLGGESEGGSSKSERCIFWDVVLTGNFPLAYVSFCLTSVNQFFIENIEQNISWFKTYNISRQM